MTIPWTPLACMAWADFWGRLLAGVFATLAFNQPGAKGWIDGVPGQVWKQLVAASASAAIASIGTLILLVAIDETIGLRISRRIEIQGMGSRHPRRAGLDARSGAGGGLVEMPGSASMDVSVARDRAREKASKH